MTTKGTYRKLSHMGVAFEVDVDNILLQERTVDLWSANDGVLNISGSGFFSKETAEMKALRGLYQATGKYTKEGYYLFVLSTAKADGEPDQHLAAQGDMPRGMQFGYIFRGGGRVEDKARTVAHELGHGIFALEHTFDVNFAGDNLKAQTRNLMDYADGTVLGAFQWNRIAHPAPLTFFDNDKDAMAAGGDVKHLRIHGAARALRQMWFDSFKEGKVLRELAAWELKDGSYIVEYNPKNTINESFLSLPAYTREGKLYVLYEGEYLEIVSRVHTHPNPAEKGLIGISDQDIRVYNSHLKNGVKMKIIFNRALYQITGPNKQSYEKLEIQF